MHPRLAPLVLLSTLALGGCPSSKPAPVAPEPPAPAPVGDEPAGGGDRPHFSSFQIEDNHLVLPGPIVFTSDSLAVDASASALWFIHDYLEAKDYITLLRLEGHGDQPGNDAMMMTGAEALAVGEWLVGSGIDCKRLLAVAFGDSKPIADPSSADGRAKNRRIEAVNAELRGRAIGGMPADGGGVAAPVCN